MKEIKIKNVKLSLSEEDVHYIEVKDTNGNVIMIYNQDSGDCADLRIFEGRGDKPVCSIWFTTDSNGDIYGRLYEEDE